MGTGIEWGVERMTRRQAVTLKVMEMIRAQLPKFAETGRNIAPHEWLKNLGASPEDLGELTVAFEREFNLDGLPDDWVTRSTFGDVLEYIFLLGDLEEPGLYLFS